MCLLTTPILFALNAASVVLLAVAAVIILKTIPLWLLAGGSQEVIREAHWELTKALLWLLGAVLAAALPSIIGWFPAGADLLARCG